MSKSGVVAVVLSALSLSCATSSSQPEARATPQPKLSYILKSVRVRNTLRRSGRRAGSENDP